MWWMARNSSGQRDGIFTFAVVAFIVMTCAVVFSMFESVSIMEHTFTFSEPDFSLLSVYFAGAFTSYVMRRNAKDRNESIRMAKIIERDSDERFR